MTQAPPYSTQAVPAAAPPAASAATLTRVRRSVLTPAPFAVAAVITGISWTFGGLPRLTDLGFAVITLTCLAYVVIELIKFPTRFGAGGLMMFAGILAWFSYDYHSTWFGANFAAGAGYTATVVAKGAFIHALGITAMSVGLLIPWGRRVQRLIVRFPEPSNRDFYLMLVLILFVIGISPYFRFTEEPWYKAIAKDMVGGYRGGATWTVGRSDDNLNYNWDVYVLHLLNVGQIGGILAAFYAVLLARTALTKAIGFGVWAFWIMQTFGTGSRSTLLGEVLPVLAIVFMKYQAVAAAYARRLSKRAYVMCAIGGLILLVAIQFMGQYRDTGYTVGRLSEVDVLKLQDNGMFSAGLPGLELIPRDHDFFHNHFPGAKVVLPLPRWTYYLAIGWIPRALWHNKPIQEEWQWYNDLITGNTFGRQGAGTTISKGLLNGPYMGYGLSGVIQIALLFGWLIAICERALQNSGGRIMSLLFSLALLTLLFRSFRGLGHQNLYPILMGAAALWVAIKIENRMSHQRGA